MNNISTVFTILASAIIVCGGMVALTRAIWRAAQDLRDNKRATQANTAAIGDLNNRMDGRIAMLEARMNEMERRQRPAGW